MPTPGARFLGPLKERLIQTRNWIGWQLAPVDDAVSDESGEPWWQHPRSEHRVGERSLSEVVEAAHRLNGGARPHSGHARRIRIDSGSHEVAVISRPFVSLVGEGPDSVLRRGNEADSGLARQYPLDIAGSFHMSDLTVIGEHASYAMHADWNATPGLKTELVCERVHFLNTHGNAAVGIGAGAGQTMIFRDCTFETAGGASPLFGHNSPRQKRPSRVELIDCTFITDGTAIAWSDLGSGQPDEVIVVRPVIIGGSGELFNTSSVSAPTIRYVTA